jgi:hypothetical protein
VKRVLLALAAVLALHTASRAQDGSRAAVEVLASGGPAILAAMRDRIRALESRYPIEVRWSEASEIDARAIVAPRAPGDAAIARVWLDLRDARRAVLFIANGGHDRFLVRVVPVSDGWGELTRESLATVVESTLEALLAGGQIGVDRGAAVREIEAQTGTSVAVEPAAAAAAPAAAPLRAAAAPVAIADAAAPAAAAARGPWSLALQYRADAVASGPTLRHGAQLALAYAPDQADAVGLLVVLTTQVAPAFALGDSGRRIEAHGGGARIAVGAASSGRGLFGWQAAAGAGADLARVEPAIGADTGLRSAEPFFVTTPIATAFITGAIRPAAWLDLALGVGADVPLLAQHFDVQTGSERTQVITPWRVRPYALVGVGIALGEGAAR